MARRRKAQERQALNRQGAAQSIAHWAARALGKAQGSGRTNRWQIILNEAVALKDGQLQII